MRFSVKVEVQRRMFMRHLILVSNLDVAQMEKGEHRKSGST